MFIAFSPIKDTMVNAVANASEEGSTLALLGSNLGIMALSFSDNDKKAHGASLIRRVTIGNPYLRIGYRSVDGRRAPILLGRGRKTISTG